MGWLWDEPGGVGLEGPDKEARSAETEQNRTQQNPGEHAAGAADPLTSRF